MLALHPLPGRVLVELKDKYEHVATTEQKYDTKTSGICLDWQYLRDKSTPLSADDISEMYTPLRGKRIFWQEYKEGAVIERDGKRYAFIKIEDLDGYEDEQS